MNVFEELAAEWYEFQGYCVRKNVTYGKGRSGGIGIEMDLIACRLGSDPVHLESTVTSGPTAIEKLKKHFTEAKEAYREVLNVAPCKVKQKAIVFSAKDRSKLEDDGVEVMSKDEFMKTIVEAMEKKNLSTDSVPHSLPLLRVVQEVVHLLRK